MKKSEMLDRVKELKRLIATRSIGGKSRIKNNLIGVNILDFLIDKAFTEKLEFENE